jgi:hypothetical protein
MNFENIPPVGGDVNLVRRIASQDLGRPWTRIAPTVGVLTKTFEDKTNDSRYDGTFVTTYYANFDLAEPNVATKMGANNLTIRPNAPAWKFLPSDEQLENLTITGDGGYLPNQAYAAWTPSTVNRTRYPGVWKFGPDRADKTRNGPWNAPSTRPFPIAKFSELYFIAAEAAVKGATAESSARELVNVIRARAGVWRWDNNNRTVKEVTYDITYPASVTINIDTILMERSRELYAEGGRWYDLVRTDNLREYAKEYRIWDSAAETVEAAKSPKARDIQDYHYLRPIPREQINGLVETERDAYQNPGY